MTSVHYTRWVYHGVNPAHDVWGIRHTNDNEVPLPYSVWAACSSANTAMFADEHFRARDDTRTFKVNVHAYIQRAYARYIDNLRDLQMCTRVRV